MKRILSVLLVLVLLTVTFAYADTPDLKSMTDQELLSLYEGVRKEMSDRGLSFTRSLVEGKYIIGEDIQPGTYKIICTNTEMENLGSAYSSIGNAYGAILGDEWGNLMGSLGGAMSSISGATVKILGDYGTVLKSLELKNGDSVSLSLSTGTALEISGGSVTIEAE